MICLKSGTGGCFFKGRWQRDCFSLSLLSALGSFSYLEEKKRGRRSRGRRSRRTEGSKGGLERKQGERGLVFCEASAGGGIRVLVDAHSFAHSLTFFLSFDSRLFSFSSSFFHHKTQP